VNEALFRGCGKKVEVGTWHKRRECGRSVRDKKSEDEFKENKKIQSVFDGGESLGGEVPETARSKLPYWVDKRVEGGGGHLEKKAEPKNARESPIRRKVFCGREKEQRAERVGGLLYHERRLSQTRKKVNLTIH